MDEVIQQEGNLNIHKSTLLTFELQLANAKDNTADN